MNHGGLPQFTCDAQVEYTVASAPPPWRSSEPVTVPACSPTSHARATPHFGSQLALECSPPNRSLSASQVPGRFDERLRESVLRCRYGAVPMRVSLCTVHAFPFRLLPPGSAGHRCSVFLQSLSVGPAAYTQHYCDRSQRARRNPRLSPAFDGGAGTRLARA